MPSSRFETETGDWDYDPSKDPDWDNPARKRLVIPESEYKQLADAIVRGASVRCCVITDLKILIEAVQSHPEAKLARTTKPDADGFIHSDGVYKNNTRLPDSEEPTTLELRGCVTKACRLLDLDIGCALKVSSHFTEDANFSGTRFAGGARFDYATFDQIANFVHARFAGKASFDDTRFAGYTRFDGAHFAGEASFDDARFDGEASFDGARFDADGSFYDARFAGLAYFDGVRFDGEASFVGARFAGFANFDAVRFAGDASFVGASFAWVASFNFARFDGDARFDGARFDGNARLDEDACYDRFANFGGAQFAREAIFNRARFAGDAGFNFARFAEDAWFDLTRFDGDARFDGADIQRSATLYFTSTRIKQNLSFNSALRKEKESPAIIHGKIFFTSATLDERITFKGAIFGLDARLGFNDFLARGGATVELTLEQLTLNQAKQRSGSPLSGSSSLSNRRRALSKRRLLVFARRVVKLCQCWIGLFRPSTLIEGEDAHDAESLKRAAKDYEILASNYTKLSGTDREEDLCRWRAHELRRMASIKESAASVRSLNPARCAAGLITLIFRDLLYRWLVMRTMVGYMLYLTPIMATGAVVIIGCSLLYTFGATPETITYNGMIPDPVPDSVIALQQAHSTYTTQGVYAIWLWDKPEVLGLNFSGVYFSLTTYVTLGYGDFAPLGWFKLVTGLEALAGVTLVALFTVAWGRKMIR